jgi:hypothetical protein
MNQNKPSYGSIIFLAVIFVFGVFYGVVFLEERWGTAFCSSIGILAVSAFFVIQSAGKDK